MRASCLRFHAAALSREGGERFAALMLCKGTRIKKRTRNTFQCWESVSPPTPTLVSQRNVIRCLIPSDKCIHPSMRSPSPLTFLPREKRLHLPALFHSGSAAARCRGRLVEITNQTGIVRVGYASVKCKTWVTGRILYQPIRIVSS